MSTSCEFVAPIRRSKEIKAVCAALNAQMERGVVGRYQEGKLRVGRMNIDIYWQDARASRLRIDIEAATLTFPSLLTGVSVGSQAHRDLKALLRTVQLPSVDPHGLHIDTSKAMLRMTEQNGKLSLALIVTSGQYEYCMSRLVDLAREAFALLPERKLSSDSYQPALNA